MAHMILCAFVGGPFDGTTREVNDREDTLRFAPTGEVSILPPIAQDAPTQNLVHRYHVYRREDETSFIYGGFY